MKGSVELKCKLAGEATSCTHFHRLPSGGGRVFCRLSQWEQRLGNQPAGGRKEVPRPRHCGLQRREDRLCHARYRRYPRLHGSHDHAVHPGPAERRDRAAFRRHDHRHADGDGERRHAGRDRHHRAGEAGLQAGGDVQRSGTRRGSPRLRVPQPGAERRSGCSSGTAKC